MNNVPDVQPLLRWLATQNSPPEVLLACREHPDLDPWRASGPARNRVVFLLAECLADVPVAGLLEILAAGAPSVTALLDGCAAADAATEMVNRADQIAAALGREHQVLWTTEPPGTGQPEPGAPKRRWLRRTAVDAAPVRVLDARAMPVPRRLLVTGPDRAPVPDVHSLPGQRLFRVVREQLGDAPVPAALTDVPTGAAELSAPGCEGRGVCVRVCPTDALTLQVSDLDDTTSQFVLDVDPARCLDCGLCVQQCPEQAMRRVGSLPWSEGLAGETRTVRVALSKRCSRCGAIYRGPGPRCEPCTFRTANPFGSKLPPGFTRSRER